jgi:maleate isomerase
MVTSTKSRAAARSDLLVNKTHLPHALDQGLGARLRIGLIELATDQTSEHEFRRIFALPGVDFYESRIWNEATITPETLARMEKDIEGGMRVIMPDLRIDVAGFTCTSGAMVIGEEKVFALMRRARPGIPCSSPITGAIAGMKALGLERIALLTPYVQSINDMMRSYIEERGIAVPVMGSFNNANDDEVARITLASTRAAAIDLASSPHVDGIFVSCTSMRTIDIVREVEAETGKPMLASNPAQAWHLLRLGGVKDPLGQWGRLFTVS